MLAAFSARLDSLDSVSAAEARLLPGKGGTDRLVQAYRALAVEAREHADSLVAAEVSGPWPARSLDLSLRSLRGGWSRLERIVDGEVASVLRLPGANAASTEDQIAALHEVSENAGARSEKARRIFAESFRSADLAEIDAARDRAASASGETTSREASPGETATGEAPSGESASGETASGETATKNDRREAGELADRLSALGSRVAGLEDQLRQKVQTNLRALYGGEQTRLTGVLGEASQADSLGRHQTAAETYTNVQTGAKRWAAAVAADSLVDDPDLVRDLTDLADRARRGAEDAWNRHAIVRSTELVTEVQNGTITERQAASEAGKLLSLPGLPARIRATLERIRLSGAVTR